jgi:hypothetical protein
MLQTLLRTLVKVAVASLIVGSVMAHFGITTEVLMRQVGVTPERVEELARQAVAWAWPNMMLGSMVIVPLWFLIFILRPPGPSSD